MNFNYTLSDKKRRSSLLRMISLENLQQEISPNASPTELATATKAMTKKQKAEAVRLERLNRVKDFLPGFVWNELSLAEPEYFTRKEPKFITAAAAFNGKDEALMDLVRSTCSNIQHVALYADDDVERKRRIEGIKLEFTDRNVPLKSTMIVEQPIFR